MIQKELEVIGLYLANPNIDLTVEQFKKEFDIDLEKSPNLYQILVEIRKNQNNLAEALEANQQLMSPLGRKSEELQLSQLDESKKSLEGTMAAVGKIKEDFANSIAFSQRAFNYVMVMYIAAFYLGIGLIITAVVFAAMDKTILAIAFGTIGLADIITYFFKEPPNRIQESRANLVQMTISALSWLKEFINSDGMLAQIASPKVNNKGELVTLSAQEMVSIYKDLAADHINNTEKLLVLIDKYAEPKN